MKLQVLYFASLREALELDRETLHLDAQAVRTTSQLRLFLQARGPLWAEQFAAQRPLRVAVDQRMVKDEIDLHDGAEVAFFPPVTGG
jgi:sulfur-carrier protein